MDIPWVEKYRPTTMNNIILENTNKTILDNIIKNDYFPNLLLYGPPGTGKTTTVINLINEYYKTKYNKVYKESVIHLNASDDRGIDIIREQIYDFVNSKSIGKTEFKFVILDEVDYMTNTAQIALKIIIEHFYKNVSFILICNYISKINIPLQDLFVNIRFNKKIIKFLNNINKIEKINISNAQINNIQTYFKSDIRSMINYMQSNVFNECTKVNINNINLYESIIKLSNINSAYEYINNFSIKYNIPNIEIINRITTVFLKDNIHKIKPEHFSFIKQYYHNDYNFEIISKTLLSIFYIYN